MPRADKLIAIALCVAAVAVTTTPGAAQQWPTQPVRIVVGFGPGSTPDLMARLLADNLSRRLGKPFVVENKAGAGGNLGVAEVARAAPDGLTLGLTIPGPLIVNPMTSQLPYDPKADIAPISIIGTQPAVLVASTKLGVATLPDLITKLKQNLGKYNYASIGVRLGLSHRDGIGVAGERHGDRPSSFQRVTRSRHRPDLRRRTDCRPAADQRD